MDMIDVGSLRAIIDKLQSLGVKPCDICRLINWDVAQEIAKRNDIKFDDVAVQAAATVCKYLCN